MPTQVEFPFAGSRRIRAVFDAGAISSDGGAVLLAEVERRTGLLRSVADVLPDRRSPVFIRHSMYDLLRQRVFQIALGYEDCNDATTLRRDPVLKACVGRDPVDDGDLSSQPTLSRLENGVSAASCYRFAKELLDSYCTRRRRRPDQITLDLDTTDDPTHGQQELRFYNAYYGEHVYQPLLIFDEDGDLITAVLQPGKTGGPRAVAAVLRRIVRVLRRRWPGVPILIRGDSGFASPQLYRLCEELGLYFLVGIGVNKRLKALAQQLEEKARRRFLRTKEKVRIFKPVRYRALKGWPRSYRVVIKCEHTSLGSNTRFVVTNLEGRADGFYDWYVARGEASENSIKDLKRALKADRLSCHRFVANQFRLLLHAAAYVLMYELRRAAHGTSLAEAQMDTLRLRLLKIGARVQSTARRLWLHLSSSYPWQADFLTVAQRLVAAPGFG